MSSNHSDHHILPMRVYAMTLIGLFVLMGATLLAAEVHIGPDGTSLYNNLVAMLIAITKATLVVLFFMHGKYSTNLTKIFIILGFAWVSLMTLILADYGTRRFEPVPGWDREIESALPRDFHRLEEHRPKSEFEVNVRARP